MFRPILILICLTVLLAASACQTAVYDLENVPHRVGTEASRVAESRAIEYADTISALRAEIQLLEERRGSLLHDAEAYERMAAEAADSGELRPTDRQARAQMFRTLADQRRIASQRCEELIDMYDANISILMYRRREQQQNADDFVKVVLEKVD